MNILATYCEPTGGLHRTFDIHWRNGRRGKVVRVTVQKDLPDPQVVAELSALQWLLGQRSIFGETQGGKGLVLHVSAGAIRKAAQAAAALSPMHFGKHHLLPYAHFLATRFAGTLIEVSKDRSWLKAFPEGNTEHLTIQQPLRPILNIPAFGQVEVSAHALDRFGERLCQFEACERWRLLRNAVMGSLRQARQSPETIARHQQCHRSPGEIWVNPTLRWAFVLVPGAPRPVMVTAYAI